MDLVFEKAEKVMNKIRHFSLGEMGVFKFCLLSFGLLVGAFHSKKVKRNAFFLLLTFLLTAVYLMIRICFDDEDDYDDFDDDDLFDFDDDEDDEELIARVIAETETLLEDIEEASDYDECDCDECAEDDESEDCESDDCDEDDCTEEDDDCEEDCECTEEIA